MIDHPGQGLTWETMIHVIKLQTRVCNQQRREGGINFMEGLGLIIIYKHKKTKLKDEVGMAVPKNTQTRFVGITYHIHYTSLRLLFSIINKIYTPDSVCKVSLYFDTDPCIDFPFLHACAPYTCIICVCSYSKSKRRDI